ncbi:MAG: hypothetical protein DRH11_17370 [Deltaproteobacteria bacterium]|nr:MAG: hypothetical protein DRH11_17370 [Deltaproteobacteria bacterium]
MGVLDRIEKAEIRDLLGKGWLTHDGMWFSHTYKEFGIEKANALNKAAIKSLAPIEIDRMKQALGIDKESFDTFDELMDFMLAALELTMPQSIFKKIRFSSPSRGLIHWEWESGQCFAYKGMKQLGAIHRYRCGVMYRIGCWLEALGVTYSIHPEINGCLMHEKGACKGEFRVFSDLSRRGS